MARTGRRIEDPATDPKDRVAATLLWELPDHTRCWTMRNRGKIVVYLTRLSAILSIEILSAGSDVQALTEVWRTECGDALDVC